MKILIAYSSKTGNTEKVCKKVFENLKDEHEIDIMTVKEVSDYDDYDLLVPAFWVDKGTANKEARKFIEKIRNKNVALLGTLGASPDSEHGNKVRKNVKELVDNSNTYHGVFLARGKVDEKLIKRIKMLPLPKNIKEQMYESSVNSREPNEEEFAGATKFIAECKLT